MKIYKRIVIDIPTGKVVESDSFEYSGPVAWCDFGGGGGGGMSAEGSTNAAQQNAMINAMMYEQSRKDLAPYRDIGEKTTPYYGGILNIPGYEQVDPTEALRATPGYNWLMGQGTEAIDRSAAAKGMLGSGPVAKQLMTFGQGVGDQTYNNYMNRLSGLITGGQNAAAQTGAYGMQMASNTGNALMQAGQAQDRANYYNSQQGGGWANDLMGGLGLLGGLALTPVTGGLSNSLLGTALGWGASKGISALAKG